MPDFLQMLRMASMFGPGGQNQSPYGGVQFGNDLPSQGGITGRMPIPGQTPASPFGGFGNTGFGADTPFMAQTPAPSPTGAQDTSPGGIRQNISQRMAELYTPESVESDRFRQLQEQQPKWDEYKPGWLRAIGGALTAFGPGGQKAGLEFMNEPYERRTEEWGKAIVPASQSATIERYNNANERTMAYQTVSNELRAQADQDRANKNERDAQVRELRARVYQMKAMQPNLKFDFSGPTVMVTDPRTGEVKNTGIPTGHMDEMDKIQLNQENTLQQIGARTQGQLDVEGARQGGRVELAGMRGWNIGSIPDPNDPSKQIGVWYNPDTRQIEPVQFQGQSIPGVTRPGTAATDKPELPTQTKVRLYNAATQFRNTNPELAKWVKLGSNNSFEITPPATPNMFGFSGYGPTPDEYNQIQRTIYGDTPFVQENEAPNYGGMANQGGSPSGQSPQGQNLPYGAMTKTQTNQRTGEKRTLYSTDGGKTWNPVPSSPAPTPSPAGPSNQAPKSSPQAPFIPGGKGGW